MVTIFNKEFVSVTAALVYLGWEEEGSKVALAPELTGESFSTTTGTYELVNLGGKDTVVWVRDERLWERHAEVGGVDCGVATLDGERLADVALRQAVDMEGWYYVFLSVWSQNTVAGGPGFINFPLLDRILAHAEVLDEDGNERHILALSVGGNTLVYVGNARMGAEAEMTVRHLLKQ